MEPRVSKPILFIMSANNYDILSIIGKSIINVTNIIVYTSLVNSMYYCSALADHNMFPSFFRSKSYEVSKQT